MMGFRHQFDDHVLEEIDGPLLCRLEEDRVCVLYRVIGGEHDGKFMLQDGCDKYFETILTRDELRNLGQELIHAANGS